MITINPFSELSEFIPSIAMQMYVIAMVILVAGGTMLDMAHKQSAKFFFRNSEKAKKLATNPVSTGEKASIALKTVAEDVLTSGEFCNTKRRIAHLLTMYGFVIFVTTTAIMIFCYASITAITPSILPLLWHIGALMLCVGGYWFWFFLRVDVSAEGNPWYRIVRADLFVLSLVITATLGLIWSYLQSKNIDGWDTLFLILFGLSNLVLFGGIYWSKFAHMFYKPGAAIQKRLAEADGSNENLPYPTDKPKQFGLGIKRDAPKHY